MDLEQKERLFRRGVALTRSGAMSEAVKIFRILVQEGTDDPLQLSYCGLLTAVVYGENREGLKLCERALAFGVYEPEVVVNVARLYERIGMSKKAVQLLRRGLREKPKHPGMMALINRLSPRRRPPLSFVERENCVNKALAVLLAKLGGGQEGSKIVRQAQAPRRRTAAST